jgi:O-antigen ligase
MSMPRAAIWPALIVFGVLVLLPVGRASEAPFAIGGIVAIIVIARRSLDLRDAACRLVLALFACYWLPALLSSAAAVEPSRTWSTIATTLRFLPFALFALWALRRAQIWPAATAAVAAVVLLWTIDAYVQITTGHSLGGAPESERLSGIFGAGNLKLGPVLAVLSPFFLLAARERYRRRGLVFAALVLIAPILLSGARAAWLSYALVCLLIAWHETRDLRRLLVVLLVLALGVGTIGALALHDSTGFGNRIERSLLALRGTEVAIDEASAGRISIWRTASRMLAAHPLTGVGVRGFRYAYPKYAAPGDRFVDTTSDLGASHAHQIVLEVLSETGIVGLVCWIAGLVFALRAWWRADAAARMRARAPALALIAMCFPLNTHLAFYSAWWGLLFWWLLALYCAALGAREDGVVSARALRPATG